MRVLGIDPGYDRCGVAIVELSNSRETVCFSGCIETDRTLSLNQRLFHIGESIEKIIITEKPTALAIETLFFNKNITTGIGVAAARGIILYVAQKHNLNVYEYGPQEVKVAVTGYGKSDKTAVHTMVQRLVHGVPHKAHDDEYDAIAVATTCLAQAGRGTA